MNRTLFHIIFLFLFFIESISLSAQVRDFGSWNSLSVSYEVFDDFELKLNQELRFGNNLAYLTDYLTEVEVGYDISKHFQFGLGYRIQRERDFEDTPHWAERYYSNIQYGFKIDRFKVKFREQYQYEPAWYGNSEWSYFSFSYLRHKFSIDYNIKGNKLNPFVDLELCQILNHPVRNSIIKQRYTVGVEYPVTKFLDAGVDVSVSKKGRYVEKTEGGFYYRNFPEI